MAQNRQKGIAMNNKYNGWTNYETWNVNLYMMNDEALHAKYLEILEQPDAAGELKRFVMYVFDRFGRFGDLTTKKELAKVNYKEIVSNE